MMKLNEQIKTLAGCCEVLAVINAMTEEEFDQFCFDNSIIRRYCGLDARDELPHIIQSEIDYHEEFDGRVFDSEEERQEHINKYLESRWTKAD